MINFACKSEVDRFMRVSKLILSLQAPNREDVNFVYSRILRFLSDILTPIQFQELSYFHVSRLIRKIQEISDIKEDNQEKQPNMGLKEFIYRGK